MPEYLTPGVYHELRVVAPRFVHGLRTDIAGFVGLSERGPIGRPVRIDSWRHFQTIFGGFVSFGYLSYAVKGFFENGGRTCFVVRVAGATAAAARVRVKSPADPSVDAIVFRALDEGAWGNAISITTFDAASDKRTFSIAVTAGGRDREVFANLSLEQGRGHRNVVRVLAEGDDRTPPSRWICAEPLGTVPGLPPLPVNGRALLAGGLDGLASLTREDFLGLSAHRPGGGLQALTSVDDVAIVCLPDIHIRPAPPAPRVPAEDPPLHDPCLPRGMQPGDAVPVTPPVVDMPPRFTEGDIEIVQRALIEHCESRRDRVAILDLPLRDSGETRSAQEALAWRTRLESERGYAALYHPWIRVIDPGPDHPQVPAGRRLQQPGGQHMREVPPCGHVAGVYARTEVHHAPANAELLWAEDVTALLDDDLQAMLNPRGINCLRPFPGRGIRVYGARTVSSDPAWRFVSTRRLLLMIEEAIEKSMQWSVFEPHDRRLREAIRQSVSGFLERLWRGRALAGASPQESFYVKCDDTTNPPAEVDEGRLLAEVGVAPAAPSEFIVLRVGRTAEEIEVVER